MNATGEGEQLELKWGARLPPLAFPHPVPLPIVAVGKVGEYDHTKIWGIRLKLGENRFAVLRVAAKDDELSPTAKDSLAFLVEKANGDSLLNPVSLAESHSFNTHELSAIQHGYVDRGISEKAVICAIGIPEQINDYGRAGRQLVYNSGNLLVYIDSTGYVEEIHKSY